jgi:hypothetical protein
MANIFSSAVNNFGDWLGRQIAPYINDALGIRGNILASYYTGDHRKQLKVKQGAPDPNIIQNYIGLAVDRSVSRLFKGGVKFKLPEGATAQQEYLDKVWDVNKKEIILYQYGLHGAYSGTTYFKICPDEAVDPYTGDLYPKLIAINPEIIRVKTEPDDMNDVEEYIIQYKYSREYDGRVMEVAVKEITKHPSTVDTEAPEAQQKPDQWVVETWEQIGGAPWQLVESAVWPYDFPPIIHQKNLPSLNSCYGDSEIDDVINVQDKNNFVVSNTGIIIKNHAHPSTFIFGISPKQLADGRLDGAVGTIYAIADKEAKASNLEMQSDLASSRAFALDLRQSIFDIAREIDISSMADKIGQLTNFGLQVLWSDAIDKNDTKRQLYGDALLELNRRLLVLGGWGMEASNPGTIQWGSALPINIAEEMAADKLALELGIIDKQSVAERYFSRYGREWDDIEAALEEEKTSANEGNANIGAMLLNNFSKGQGEMPLNMQKQKPMMEKNGDDTATSGKAA